VLGEAPAPVAFLGGAVAIGGVIFARSQPAKPSLAAPAAEAPATEAPAADVRGAA